METKPGVHPDVSSCDNISEMFGKTHAQVWNWSLPPKSADSFSTASCSTDLVTWRAALRPPNSGQGKKLEGNDTRWRPTRESTVRLRDPQVACYLCQMEKNHQSATTSKKISLPQENNKAVKTFFKHSAQISLEDTEIQRSGMPPPPEMRCGTWFSDFSQP